MSHPSARKRLAIKRMATVAVVAGAPVIFVATTQVASATAPPPSPPGDSAPVADSIATESAPTASVAEEPTDITLPDGYSFIRDDLQTITVAVPDAWSDVVTTPTQAPTLTDMSVPYLAASTDVNAFETGFEAPGVRMVALPFLDSDPQPLVEQYGLTEENCPDITSEPYDDPVFEGTLYTGSNCGDSGATWRIIVASPAARDFTVIVDVQTLTPEDEEAYEVVLQTFNLVEGAVPPGSSVPGMSTPGSSTPAGGVADDMTDDTTGEIVTLPATTESL